MKKRSVLILLDKPKTIEHVLLKSVFPKNEIVEEIDGLIREGFIALSGDATLAPVTRAFTTELPAAAPPPPSDGTIHLDDEIILSEAKFMLTDFSVDSFGTQSQAFVDAIRACKSVQDIRLCLSGILAATEKQCPNQLPALLGLIKEINETT
ncbi:MAG: hypothetical protein HHJ12_17535 [Glaciimonas sp.]|nr:hypothetical protein [Glaciimonas sp.]